MKTMTKTNVNEHLIDYYQQVLIQEVEMEIVIRVLALVKAILSNSWVRLMKMKLMMVMKKMKLMIWSSLTLTLMTMKTMISRLFAN